MCNSLKKMIKTNAERSILFQIERKNDEEAEHTCQYGEPDAANALTGVRAVVVKQCGFARMASCLNRITIRSIWNKSDRSYPRSELLA